MTTIVPFTPSSTANFQFQAELDGNIYNVVVTWGLFGRRYYINIYALDGTLIVAEPAIGSPTGVALEALTWNDNGVGQVQATTANPHGFTVGTTVTLAISGVSPDAFNGVVQAFITGPLTFTYPLSADPGAASTLGAVSYNINLVGGYFETSSLVYRTQANQFEVAP